MTIIHIVLFEWKSSASADQIQEACKRMQALGENCIHPTSKKPYIKSITGGKNNSPEEYAKPYTHGFVVEFENTEDRDYYVNKDQAHIDFGKSLADIFGSVKVVDYEPGEL